MTLNEQLNRPKIFSNIKILIKGENFFILKIQNKDLNFNNFKLDLKVEKYTAVFLRKKRVFFR